MYCTNVRSKFSFLYIEFNLIMYIEWWSNEDEGGGGGAADETLTKGEAMAIHSCKTGLTGAKSNANELPVLGSLTLYGSITSYHDA